MSESSFPFQGQTMTRDPLTPEERIDGEAGSQRRKLVLLVGGAAVVVLAALVYFLLLSGGGDVEDTAAPVRPRVVAPLPSSSSETADKTKKQRDRVSAKNFGRNPFEPRIVEAVSVTGTTTQAGTTPTGPTTTAPASGTGSGTSTAGSSGTAAPTESVAHSFKVVDVAPDNSRVSVKVDGRFYRNLKAGEVFATYFKVVLIGGTVNSFQFGDDKFNVVGTKRLTIA